MRLLATALLALAAAACASRPAPEETPAPKATLAAEETLAPKLPSAAPKEPPAATALVAAVPVAASALDRLRAAFVHVQTFDPARGTLWIDCAAATQLEDGALAELLVPVKDSVAHLGLARTRAGGATLAVVATMPNLERLDLRATAVDDAALARLGAHAKLATLVVEQTKLDARGVDVLVKLPALVELHVWRSGLDAQAIERLRVLRPALRVDAGDTGPAKPVEEEPVVQLVSGRAAPAAPSAAPAAASALKPINATCPVSGTPVNPAYTIVFEGRVIGFCCPNCPTKFWADPQSYRSKLPQ
ncbi:MAG: hypothetical protein HZA53_10395 [Planctomycetes bacterium]|nr:hypothetical protein [Planctomycetota bacterium]